MSPTRSRLEEILFIRSELNRLVEDLHQPVLDHSGSWLPPMDCSEDERAYYLNVELPGVTLEGVNLQVRQQKIILEGDRESLHGVGTEDFQRIERFYGPFRRSIHLPQAFDWERVDAKLERGVLTIVVPKKGTEA